MPNHWILILNAGSSSLKFALVNAVSGERPFQGLAECLGLEEARINFYEADKKQSLPIADGTMYTAIAMLMDALPDKITPEAIGHRVVHGGEKFKSTALITPEVLKAIDTCSNLAPLHNPANIAGIKAARALFPGLPQVAVFDTAFHANIPAQAYYYGIPAKFYEKYGIRKYGFHGISHHYVAIQAAKHLRKSTKDVQLITAHLGNGCSVSAIKGGHSVDTSMGMTPLAGPMMGTRSGDIDPGIIFWLAEQQKMPLKQISHMLNKESGLLGISSLSNDMRTLEQVANDGNKQAKLAIDIFCYQLAKSIATMSVSLSQIDALVFTGGIGENSSLVRQKVISQLLLMGFACDEKKNNNHGSGSNGHIELTDSKKILVIPTDEEQMIACETYQLIGKTYE